MKPRFLEAKVLTALGICQEAKPADFPSTEKIVRKVSTVKGKLRKQNQSTA